MTRYDILDTISDLEEKISKLKNELPIIYSDDVTRVVRQEIGNLEDNLYRYKLQARAWKLID